jgi:hypothetical protein
MAVLVPEQGKPHTQVTKYAAAQDIYQTEVRQPVMAVAPGATGTTDLRFFAGAKEWAAIRAYQKNTAGWTACSAPRRRRMPRSPASSIRSTGAGSSS